MLQLRRATRTDHQVSRYTVVGPTTYRHPSGSRVRVVYHTASARVFLLDVVSADALAAGRQPPHGRRRLVELGLLVPPDAAEASAVIDAGRRAAARAGSRRFVIMPAAYCNMGCSYCGQRHTRGVLPGRHRDRLVARVDAAVASGRYSELDIRWFGGEPLTGYAVLRDLSRRFVSSAERHGVRYTSLLVTNGALLDHRKLVQLATECRVCLIEITVDGPAEVHDRSRPLRSGHGSFARIVAAVRSALDDPALDTLWFTIRTNIGVHNANLADRFAEGMRQAGLAHPRVRFYPAPVRPWGNDVSQLAVSFQDLARVELEWLRAYQAHGLATTVLPTSTRQVVCVATNPHGEVVAPDGGVFSCTEQPLVPGLSDRNVAHLETLSASSSRPAGDFDDWYDTLERNQTGCRDCQVLPVCGGQCPKLWREGSPPCPTLKINLPQRLDLYAESLGLVPD